MSYNTRMPRPHRLIKSLRKSIRKKKKKVPIRDLAHEVHRVANVLEKQNRFSRRFVMALIVGFGTAIGATVVAAFGIIFLRGFLLELFGIDIGDV